MEGLRPCPFCGGEAKIQEYNGGFAAVGCSNGRCYMHPHALGFPSADRAAEMWNMRAERTCHVKQEPVEDAGFLDALAMDYPEIPRSEIKFYRNACSGCGASLTDDYRYCPHCGAKVVNE